MSISSELFEEICGKVIAIYELSRKQKAPALTTDFQRALDNLTLDAALKSTLNFYDLEGKINLTEQGWTDLCYWARKEIVQILRMGFPNEKVQPELKQKPTRARHSFLYETLRINPEHFRQYYGVDEDDFWRMLANISQAYQASQKKNAKEPRGYRNTQSRRALLSAAKEVVEHAGIEEVQQCNLRSALLSITSRAGFYAKYLEWLQPKLPLSA